MASTSISDLAVLGIAGQAPAMRRRIVEMAKSLAPELWQPTAHVIHATIERNLIGGNLRRTENHAADNLLATTGKGDEQLRILMLKIPDGLSPFGARAVEAVQFCILDAVDRETATTVLRRYAQSLRDRLAASEIHRNGCPCRKTYSRLWREMEQRRLQSMVQFLSAATQDAEQYKAGTYNGSELTQ